MMKSLKLAILSLGLIPLELALLYQASNIDSVKAEQIQIVENENKNIEYKLEKETKYPSFPFREELPFVEFHAKRYGVSPELLMAIRISENGEKGKEYGIIPQGEVKTMYDLDKGYFFQGNFYSYRQETEKQMAWAAYEIKQAMDTHKKGDFIQHLAKDYAPRNVKNDPKNLNKNWPGNVRANLEKLVKERPTSK